MAVGSGTKSDPWVLTTPPGTSEYAMYQDEQAYPPILVCQVGSTTVAYLLRAIEDLRASVFSSIGVNLKQWASSQGVSYATARRRFDAGTHRLSGRSADRGRRPVPHRLGRFHRGGRPGALRGRAARPGLAGRPGHGVGDRASVGESGGRGRVGGQRAPPRVPCPAGGQGRVDDRGRAPPIGSHVFGIEALELEITEGTAMANPCRSTQALGAHTQMGVTLSIDDYGTGQSSLVHLQRLPVRRLKIDRSFVTGMADGDSAAVVRSTVDLGRNLGLRVVAEGVDTERLLSRLRTLGCDSAQGFLLSRPIPAGELEDWFGTRVGRRTSRMRA